MFKKLAVMAVLLLCGAQAMGANLHVDPKTGASYVTDEFNGQIAMGSLYEFTTIFVSLPVASTAQIIIATHTLTENLASSPPLRNEIVARFSVTCATDCIFQITTSPLWSTSAVSGKNANFRYTSAASSGSLALSAGSSLTDGTAGLGAKLYEEYIPVPDGTREYWTRKFIFSPQTNYAISIDAKAIATVGLKMQWYENKTKR